MKFQYLKSKIIEMDCIFCKIASHEIKSNIIYEDETMVVFPDIHPVSSVHLLIVPKEHIGEIREIKEGREKGKKIWEKILDVALRMIKKEKLEGKGYRLVINGGGSQVVNHLHAHLIGNISKDKSL